MWITQDERRLLRGYYRLIGDIQAEEAFRVDGLGLILTFWGYRKEIPKYEDPPAPETPISEHEALKRAIRLVIQNRNRVKKANSLLVARNLIKFTPHDSDENVVIISLTLDGYDLGRKYSGWLERSGLWFKEYRNHWLWLLFAMIGGGVIGKLLELIWASLVKH